MFITGGEQWAEPTKEKTSVERVHDHGVYRENRALPPGLIHTCSGF